MAFKIVRNDIANQKTERLEMKNAKRLTINCFLAGLAILVLFVAVPLDGQAAETSDAQSIQVSFHSAFGPIYEWDFPYSDSMFEASSEDFSNELAKASLGLAVSAFRKEVEELDDQYETYLKAAGFTDIYAFGYDEETSWNTLSGVIASKKIGDYTLIAAAPAGQGYKNEWAGNMEVGDEERHVGFNKAAIIMEDKIAFYIEEHHLDGKLKLWLTGFSRASAVSNLTAADMIDSGLFEDVYAYLFAVPRTTRDPYFYMYKGIYNICGTYDPVTQIPLQSWGYVRYGTDLFTPVPEMDSKYIEMAFGCFFVSLALMDDAFWYNPEVSYQLHLIIEFIGEMFPSSAEYSQKLQDKIMDLWRSGGTDSVLIVLAEAIDSLDGLDQRQEYSSDILIDYLSYVSSQHLKQDQQQVEKGYWNPDQGIAENVMREHSPYTYIDWIFSGNDIQEICQNIGATRRLYLYGDIDILIYKDGTVVKGISSDGNMILPDDDEISEMTVDDIFTDVFLMRHGSQTVTCLPFDGDYEIRIKTDGTDNITYYDVICSPSLTYGMADTMVTAVVTKGEYILDLPGSEDMHELQAAQGNIIETLEVPISYSPTMIMADESGAEHHLTIDELLLLLVCLLAFIILLLIVCLVISIVHAVKKRKHGKTYSPLFVIVPHVLLIIVFALITQYCTYNLYVISIARVICAGLTMLVIFLLALRGFIRKRSIANLVITSSLLLAGILNVFLYQESSAVSSVGWHFAIYGACIAALCALAAATFYVKRKPFTAGPDA